MPQEDPPVRPVRLPGAGTRFDLHDEDGHPLSVVALQDGGAEFYPPGGGTSFTLDASTTRSLAAALAGHLEVAPEVLDRLDRVIGGLTLDWVRVPKGSPVIGRSIADLEVRRRTGVTIVAILRGSLPVMSPEPEQRLQAGDELVVAGRGGDCESFEDFLARPPREGRS